MEIVIVIYKNKCENCQSEFETDIHNQYYCSEDCKYSLYKCECIRCEDIFYSKIKGRKYCSERCRSANCINCGRVFVGKSSHREKFCSDGCRIEYNTKTCDYCSKQFYSTGSSKFCSTECKSSYNKAMKHKAICKNCKSIITFSGFDVPEYCSDECKNEYLEKQKLSKNKRNRPSEKDLEEIIKYRVKSLLKRKEDYIKNLSNTGLNYYNISGFDQKLKEKVKQRDGYKCYICERDDSLDVHHILNRVLGGNHEMDNLVTLCKKCHGAIETGDEQFAFRKCLKNAKRYYGYKVDDLIHKLNNLESFQLLSREIELLHKLIVNKENENEIILCLAKIQDVVDDKLNK